jgi:hypothetical protein
MTEYLETSTGHPNRCELHRASRFSVVGSREMLVGSSYLRGDHLSGRGVPLVARSWRLAFKNLIAIKQFESVLTRGANENSVLTPEASKKRESESSEPIFCTDGRNPEGCVRETEISLQTEIAAVWAGETRKA